MPHERAPERSVTLVGHPNIGKSVLFHALTGVQVRMANYVGTTVDITEGRLELDGLTVRLLDLPGTYSLDASNEAEQVTVRMLQEHRPDAILCVLDACHLESSLHLLLQVLTTGVPVVAILNRMDLAEECGESIDLAVLEGELGIPVVPTVAVEPRGLDRLRRTLGGVLQHRMDPPGTLPPPEASSDPWARAGEICRRACRTDPRPAPTPRQIWGERLLRPWPGLPLALLILGLVSGFVVGAGMALRRLVLLPLIRGILIPAISDRVQGPFPDGIWHGVLIGEYGFLTKGLEWPFTLVLPYVISFYLALAVLEDSGYLPRLGGLLDGLLRRAGIAGAGIVPLLLGYGCAIPAILGTRSLATRRERIALSTLVCLGVPCVAQSSAFVALLGERSLAALLLVVVSSLVILLGAGCIIDRVLPGRTPPTVLEIPDLLAPRWDVVASKVWLRVRFFLKDGALPIMLIVGVAALLYETGLMEAFGLLLGPLVVHWLGLPPEAATPLLLGIFRRELAVLPLVEMDLDTLQLYTGAMVGLLYVPCVAVLATLAREFSLRMAGLMLLVTLLAAFGIGGAIAGIGRLLFL